MAKNIIELNGKRYDAVTGKMLVSSTHHTTPASHHAGKVIDGIMRSQTKHAAAHPAPSEAVRKPHMVAPHATAHDPERAKTLMRHAVKRPTHSLKRDVKVAIHTGVVAKKPAASIMPKYSWQALDEHRLKHAKLVSKSNLVSHFASAKLTTPHSKHIASKPVHLTIPPRPEPITQQASTDIFERALAHANSHRQPSPPVRQSSKKRRLRQVFGFSASMLIAACALGFVVFQNVTAIQVHIASSRAGINSTMPSWQPSGFAVQQFAASPGKLVISFASDNDRRFSLTQTASSWDSTALLNEYISPHNNTYDTIQADGRTIYTYGDNDASWVTGGIWYQLNTNGTLSTSQLVRLATST